MQRILASINGNHLINIVQTVQTARINYKHDGGHFDKTKFEDEGLLAAYNRSTYFAAACQVVHVLQ